MSVHSALRALVRDPTGAAGPVLYDRLSAGRAVNVTGPEDPDVSLCAIADGSLAPDLAVIVVDARAGVLAATRREAFLMMLLGIRPAAFAIVEPPTEADDERYQDVTRACTDLARRIGLAPVVCFPVVPRPVKPGSLPLPTFLDQLAAAGPARRHDRGPELPETDRVRATIVWTHACPVPGKHAYRLRIGTRELTATVTRVEHRLDLGTLRPVGATQLQRGQIGDCDLELSASIPAAAYAARGDRGGFVLFDPRNHEPVGLGLVRVALRRAQNPHRQSLTPGGAARAARLGQTPCVVWLTGHSDGDLLTLGRQVETDLQRRGHHTYLLDGDNVRYGLNRDLGVSDADRAESARRVAEVAKLMVDAGLIVIACIRFAGAREMAQSRFDSGQFFEVQVDAALSVAEAGHAVLDMLQSRGVLTPE